MTEQTPPVQTPSPLTRHVITRSVKWTRTSKKSVDQPSHQHWWWWRHWSSW